MTQRDYEGLFFDQISVSIIFNAIGCTSFFVLSAMQHTGGMEAVRTINRIHLGYSQKDGSIGGYMNQAAVRVVLGAFPFLPTILELQL